MENCKLFFILDTQHEYATTLRYCAVKSLEKAGGYCTAFSYKYHNFPSQACDNRSPLTDISVSPTSSSMQLPPWHLRYQGIRTQKEFREFFKIKYPFLPPPADGFYNLSGFRDMVVDLDIISYGIDYLPTFALFVAQFKQAWDMAVLRIMQRFQVADEGLLLSGQINSNLHTLFRREYSCRDKVSRIS